MMLGEALQKRGGNIPQTHKKSYSENSINFHARAACKVGAIYNLEQYLIVEQVHMCKTFTYILGSVSNDYLVESGPRSDFVVS